MSLTGCSKAKKEFRKTKKSKKCCNTKKKCKILKKNPNFLKKLNKQFKMLENSDYQFTVLKGIHQIYKAIDLRKSLIKDKKKLRKRRNNFQKIKTQRGIVLLSQIRNQTFINFIRSIITKLIDGKIRESLNMMMKLVRIVLLNNLLRQRFRLSQEIQHLILRGLIREYKL